MTMPWTADVSNDPADEHNLRIELYEDDQHRATLHRGKSGQLMLTVFPDQGPVVVPAGWLRDIIDGAERDLP